jgi:hypothetical protein
MNEYWLFMALLGNAMDYYSTKAFPFKELEGNFIVKILLRFTPLSFITIIRLIKFGAVPFLFLIYLIKFIFFLEIFAGFFFVIAIYNADIVNNLRKREVTNAEESDRTFNVNDTLIRALAPAIGALFTMIVAKITLAPFIFGLAIGLIFRATATLGYCVYFQIFKKPKILK